MFRFLFAAPVLAAAITTAHAGDAPYRLGPQDQLQIRVYDLRAGTGEAHPWEAFNGPFTVDASGSVFLPLVGDVPAGDKTTVELADVIAERLQSKVGLAVRPDASVQIVKYRPFFILGSVEKPGDYEYRPGMTVLQAVSVAGGLVRVTGDALFGYARDTLSTQGDLRALQVARLALMIRQARLGAEIEAAPTMKLPPEADAYLGQPDVARLVNQERALLVTRRAAVQSQVDSLTATKVTLSQEIESLKSKDDDLGKLLDVTHKELDQISGLVSRGIVVLPRQLALEQDTMQFETQRLDVRLASLRAIQDLSKADRDILDIQNNRKTDALQEATEIRNKIAEANEKIATARSLIDQAETQLPELVAANTRAKPDYFLVRWIDGQLRTIPAGENDEVLPGDVVRVEPRVRGADTDNTSSKHQTSGSDLSSRFAQGGDSASRRSPNP